MTKANTERKEVKPHQVKKAYIAARRRISPSYKPSDRWKSCWVKAANLINKEGFDVADFIAAQFKYVYPFPHPNVIFNSNSLYRYSCYANRKEGDLGKYREDVNKRFTSMVDLLERKIAMGFTPKEVLSKKLFNFTPLFRVSVCYKLTGDIEAVKKWEGEAVEEYESHPVYQELYDDWRGV